MNTTSQTPASRFYLVSRSPRRRELLAQIGLRHDALPPRGGSRRDGACDETPLRGENPADYVCRLAVAKAQHGLELLALRRRPLSPLLAADTALDLDGEIIGKPGDDLDAIATLQRLSGRQHRVLTAICVIVGESMQTRLVSSEVSFRDLDDKEIQLYIASGEHRDKAGSYGLQGRAGAFISNINGSCSGIVGLPLCETLLLLREMGVPV